MDNRTKTANQTVVILDWDQTCTKGDSGSNQASTHYGLDYITDSKETVTQKYLVSGLKDI